MEADYSVADLVPVTGRMSLLSRIVGYGDDWLEAEVTVKPDGMFAAPRGVPAWVGMEYMAQTIGAYAGLQEREKGGAPKIGFLLGTRKYQSSTDYFVSGQTLALRVEREMIAENGLSVFTCELKGRDVTASARLSVFQPEDGEAFLRESVK